MEGLEWNSSHRPTVILLQLRTLPESSQSMERLVECAKHLLKQLYKVPKKDCYKFTLPLCALRDRAICKLSLVIPDHFFNTHGDCTTGVPTKHLEGA